MRSILFAVKSSPSVNAAIGEYVDVLAAAHELNRLGFELFAQSDEDFKVFAAVSSETEDLPIVA